MRAGGGRGAKAAAGGGWCGGTALRSSDDCGRRGRRRMRGSQRGVVPSVFRTSRLLLLHEGIAPVGPMGAGRCPLGHPEVCCLHLYHLPCMSPGHIALTHLSAAAAAAGPLLGGSHAGGVIETASDHQHNTYTACCCCCCWVPAGGRAGVCLWIATVPRRPASPIGAWGCTGARRSATTRRDTSSATSRWVDGRGVGVEGGGGGA